MLTPGKDACGSLACLVAVHSAHAIAQRLCTSAQLAGQAPGQAIATATSLFMPYTIVRSCVAYACVVLFILSVSVMTASLTDQ